MKLYLKKIFIFIIILMVLIFIFFITDFLLVKNTKQPIFCKTGKQYWDGGSYECYGIFYKVNVYKDISGKIEYVEIGSYNLEFDKDKVNLINDKNIHKDYYIETDEKLMCFGTIKEYYKDKEQKIYLYCLNKINLYDGKNNKISLKNYIKNNDLTIEEAIDELVSKLNLEESLWDGGTEIYRDTREEKYTNNGLTVIRCNTIENNKDIYIGPNSMKKKDNFCK